MKLLGVLLALAVLVAPVFANSEASAQAPKYNTKLEVTGVVLPAQHVVVDEQGYILKIFSNTTKDVTPKAYLNSLGKQNLIELTPEIYEQYRQIVPEGRSKVGILYERVPGGAQFIPLESLQRTQLPKYGLPTNFWKVH